MRTELSIQNGVARITMDDGKVNAMSVEMLEEICDRLDRCRDAARVTVLRGRPGIFSAGFDMPTFSRGLEPVRNMMAAGMHTIARMLTHPQPIVAACTGHAYPMGAFLLMSADVRYGIRGDYRIGMNEVAIGLTVPRFALALAEHRLDRAGFARIATGELVSPDAAAALGYLDHAVEPGDLDDCLESAIVRLSSLDPGAYAATKKRMWGALADTISAMGDRETLEAEIYELASPPQ